MSELEKLAEHRDALLLAEAAAWLHMLGKFHEDFLAGNHDLDVQIPPDLTANFPQLHSLLTDPWPGALWSQIPVPEFGAATLSFFDLISSHRKPRAPSGLARLLWDAHGRGSGIEKGVLERFAPGQRMSVFPATALGREVATVDLNDLRTKRQQLYRALERWLQELRNANAAVDWATFRRDFISRLGQDFRVTVAETRRPMNDVTLFDQTAASVAMFKAALAQNLLSGWKEPVQNAIADKYKWRILRVGIDGPSFWGQAARLSDLLARKALLESALDTSRRLLEETYPLGMEVYRDENGSLFIVPDIANLLEASAEGRSLRDRLSEIAAQALDEEASCWLELSKPTRNMLALGQLAAAMLPAPTPSPRWLERAWKNNKPADICPVCGLRPQGPGQKAAARKVCDVCERRRADRARQWASDLKSTIWTDEVADMSGRLALVVGSFGQIAWLRGDAFSSVLMFDPATRSLNDPGRNNKQYEFDYSLLLQDLQQAVRRNQFTGNTLLDNLVLSNARGGGLPQFYDLQVVDSDLGELGPHPKAELLALAMLRQNPSFARLRRVWETTRAFWQEVLPTGQGRDGARPLVGEVVEQSGPRLAIIPADRDNRDLGLFHTYELVVNGIRLSVVWDSDNRRFITCDNLDYLAKPEQLGRKVAEVVQPGRTFALEEPAGYGGANRKLGTVTVARIEPLAESYTPAIPILAEPRTFMAFVPADKALEVVKAIKAKYEREMGKVRNRLPLTLGVVYAGRRTPLAALLDAGRRMLRRSVEEMRAEVKSVTPPVVADAAWPTVREVTLRLGERQITVAVPTVMGDGKTPDVWYPYWQAAGKPTDRTRWFMGADGEHWVHVCDLRAGDAVAFTPSTFDFEYLDTTARRFEVAYGPDGRRRGKEKRQRPYLLEELVSLDAAWEAIAGPNGLTNSQIHALRDLIEEKRAAWQPTAADCAGDAGMFWQFCRDAILTAQWPQGRRPAGEALCRLAGWAVRGLLADVIELRMGIMKESAQRSTSDKESTHE